MTLLPEIYSLWEKSYGDPRVSIAILDGPVDQGHTCFQGAKLTQLKTLAVKKVDRNLASQHGTHVTSVIFGQRNSAVSGIAPLCKGLIIPIFTSGKNSLLPCSQLDLARAIIQAVEQGANVINISGGQFSQSDQPDRLLANAVRLCADRNVLIVAAAGNDGCNCLHIPAAIPSVLAVGAMDAQGNPIDFSNWGEAYQTNGILAPGKNILGAVPGGGVVPKTGTSFATPVVSGIVALLLSIQLAKGNKPNPLAIRDAILSSALPCNLKKADDCRRFLAGTLNLPGVQTLIINGGKKQVSDSELHELGVKSNEVSNAVQEIADYEQEAEKLQPIVTSNVVQVEASTAQPTQDFQQDSSKIPVATFTAMPNNVKRMSVEPNNGVTLSAESNQVFPSEGCGCEGGGTMQLVYALGELGYDFGTEARRDSIQQAMGLTRPPLPEELLYYFSGEDVEDNP